MTDCCVPNSRVSSFALLRRARIAPELRRTNHVPAVIECDEPMLLGADAYPTDAPSVHARGDRPQRPLERTRPFSRVLLGVPGRQTFDHPVRRTRRATTRPERTSMITAFVLCVPLSIPTKSDI